ncbi:MAG TPA: septum site-determining protein MinC [Chloroflexi bacterium]|nr:septum site-determining protein MinC [Chloroflexota bacterium]
MPRDRVEIRGTSKGLIVTIKSGNWQSVLEQLAQKLEQRASFFKGGRVALDVGKRLLDAEEIETVGHLLAEHQMTLWAVNGSASETQTAAKSLGLETQSRQSAPVTPPAAEALGSAAGDTLVIRRTLRSGQRVEHSGNIVVIGDVNPGAEVTAGGHVIVWGKLRGAVRVGAINPKDAFVCALQLAPMHLIIGSLISRSPADDGEEQIIPEMAFAQNGQIVAEAWK